MMETDMSKVVANQHHHWYRGRTFHVLVAVLMGILVGHFFPSVGMEIKPLADIFVRLIKMVIGPIVFIMIVTGISNAGDLRKAAVSGLRDLVTLELSTPFPLRLVLWVQTLPSLVAAFPVPVMQNLDYPIRPKRPTPR